MFLKITLSISVICPDGIMFSFQRYLCVPVSLLENSNPAMLRTWFFNNQLRRIKECTVSYIELILINKVFLRHNKSFSCYHIHQASDSLCTCVGEEEKIGPKGIQKRKQLDKSSCIEANLQCSCLFSCCFGQCFEEQMLAKEGLAFFEAHIRQVKK